MAQAGDPAQDKAFEDTAERLRELNERIIEASKKSGRAYLEAYEANLKAIAEYQAKLASASEVDWVSTLLNAQADFTREIARAAAAQSREFLK
jgi:Phasin protein